MQVLQVFGSSAEMAQTAYEDSGESVAARAAIVLQRSGRPAGKNLPEGAAKVEGLGFAAVLGRLQFTDDLRVVTDKLGALALTSIVNEVCKSSSGCTGSILGQSAQPSDIID